MIIKSMSRKSKRFDQIIRYLLRTPATEQSWYITQHLKTDFNDIEGVIKEFEMNATLKRTRMRGVYSYHEVIALHPKDKILSEQPWITYEIALEYLKRRCPNAKALVVNHLDREHHHCHFLISSNIVGSSTVVRLSKSEFRKVKLEMEQYLEREFPQLQYSRRAEKEWNYPRSLTQELEL